MTEIDLDSAQIHKHGLDLLEVNSNPNISITGNGNGDEEFWQVVKFGNLGRARIILMQEVNPNVVDPETGSSMLHFCAGLGDVALCMMLFMKGADLHGTDYDQQTPLHRAAQSGNYQLCCFLLKVGANPLALDAFGNLPVDYVPESEENTHKLLSIAKTEPGLAKELAINIASKKGGSPENSFHAKELGKLEAKILKGHELKTRLDEELATLEKTSGTMSPEKYKKTLGKLQRQRSELEAELKSALGTFGEGRANAIKKRKLSWLSIFNFTAS